MKRILFLLLILLAFAECRKEGGERLFEMVYPNIDFEIPAGLSATFPRVFELDDVPSNIEFFLSENNVDEQTITAIQPTFARLRALDNRDYDFIREISVRICPRGSFECNPADEAFYIDNLQNRARDVVDLLPTLRNMKPILTQPSFKLEVVFFFDFTTPYPVESRLEMVFEAVK